MNGEKLRLALALAAFLGWLGYLGYTAAAKSREPRVSQACLAVAKKIVVADVAAGPDGRPLARVKGQSLRDDKPFEDEIANLSQARGFSGAGKYLLLLESEGDESRLVLPPRSPGYDRVRTEPTIYPWNPAVQAQVRSPR